MACADITCESDELTEMYCEQCDKDGITVTADGFCVECTDYMCSTCLKYHKKYAPSHTQQDKSNMPQDFCFIKCSTHPNELLKFYCSTCDVTACHDCRRSNHQNCGSNVGHIPVLVQSMEYLNELKELKQTMNEMADHAVVTNEDTNSKVKQVLSNRSEVLTSIDKHQKEMKELVEYQRKEVIDALDLQRSEEMGKLDEKQRQLQQQHYDEVYALNSQMAEIKRSLKQKTSRMSQQLRTFYREKAEAIRELDEKQSQRKEQLRKEKKQLIKKINEEAKKLNKQAKDKGIILRNQVSKSNKVMSEVKQLKSDFEKMDIIDHKCELFVAVKLAKHDVTRLNKDMYKVREECEVTFYEFKPEKNINIVSPRSSALLGCLKDKSSGLIALTFVSEISTPTDHSCRITGLCKTYDSHHLVAVDFQYRLVSLLDIASNKWVFALHQDYRPYGVTQVGTNQVAVTIPNPGKIRFVSITSRNTLSVEREISVDGECHGIIHNSGSLIVLFRHIKQVQILDMDGIVLKQFSTVLSPRSIALSAASNLVYVGYDGGSVQCMDLNGKLIYKSTIDTRAINSVMEMMGTVYLSCGKTLYQLSADLSTSRKLLIQESTIHSLHYCNQEDKLYLGMVGGSRNTIKVYQIS